MTCPVCITTDLVLADRSGVEIDYCPKCRGVWLDRGELDKLIERSAASAYTATSTARAATIHREFDDDRYDRDEHYKKRKKKGFLSDIFDFD